jgi:hypothetical protein
VLFPGRQVHHAAAIGRHHDAVQPGSSAARR